ncbi:sterile alpha motif domain-containing protein 13 isoform X3 [Paroedura picta]|uniref:sterile alpha motif domain-containing protein 13 isoform X3 n=1 Tax=Paroedura picta TaxID=143630 RepID=UPI004056999A
MWLLLCWEEGSLLLAIYVYICMKKVPSLKDTSDLPMLSIDMENKENGSFDTENLVENGRPPDPADWAVTDVVNYFRTVGFEEQANAFQEQVPLDAMYCGMKFLAAGISFELCIVVSAQGMHDSPTAATTTDCTDLQGGAAGASPCV